jgi:hypothetical protein
MDPECNYCRVEGDLRTNGFTEAQVQAVFIKSGDNFPSCDLEHLSPAPVHPGYRRGNYSSATVPERLLSPRDRIAVYVPQLLDGFALAPDVEIVEALLP